MLKEKIAIITDSNSGIFSDEYLTKGVFVLPVPFIINGKAYYENITLTQDVFYKWLDEKAHVSTSQPSVGDVADFWRERLKTHDTIVHIPMSCHLSNSYDTATALSQTPEFKNRVFIVNNQRISTTQKASVMDAMKLRNNGKNAMEIKDYLEQTAFDSVIYIAVNSMEYLKRGGRITPTAAAIGSILHIKPVLQIYGERLDKYAVARTMKKAKTIMINAIQNDLETRFSKYVAQGEIIFSVEHTNNQEAAQELFTELKRVFPNIPLQSCVQLPLCASCHVGPKALAITCTRIIK